MTKPYKFLLTMLIAVVLVSCGNKSTNTMTLQCKRRISQSLSNDKVKAFAEDKQGHIWIGTFWGLNKYDSQNFHQYFCTNDSTGLPDNEIYSLFCDSKGRMWVVTANGACIYNDKDDFTRLKFEGHDLHITKFVEDSHGTVFAYDFNALYKYDEQTAKFIRVLNNIGIKNEFVGNCFADKAGNLFIISPRKLVKYRSSNMKPLACVSINVFNINSLLDSSGRLWISSYTGFKVYDSRSMRLLSSPETFNNTLHKGSLIRSISELDENTYVIATGNGVFRYDYAADMISIDTNCKQGVEYNTVFRDSHNNIWYGSADQGYFIEYNNNDQFFSIKNLIKFIGDQSVFSLDIDKNGNLFISANDGFHVFNIFTQQHADIDLGKMDVWETDPKRHYLFVDRDNNVWITTWKRVMKCHFDNMKLNISEQYNIPLILDFAQDNNGTIWAASSWVNIYALPTGRDKFSRMQLYSDTLCFIPSITATHDGYIIVSAFKQNLMQISPADMKIKELKFNSDDRRKAMTRSAFIPVDTYEDHHNNLWIATVGNGLLRYSLSSGQLTRIDSIQCLDISSIENDDEGNLWLSTMSGINKYDISRGKVSPISESNEYGGNQFNDRASCKLPDGTILFGSTHGIVAFNPKNLKSDVHVPVFFESLKVGNQYIYPEESSPINKAIIYNPEICFDHTQNNFSIGYTAIDINRNSTVKYQYMLEGIDETWQDDNSRHEAFYAHLPSGKYKFDVRVMNMDMTKVIANNSITIRIKPAPWNSWWAWLAYVLVVTMVIYSISRFRYRMCSERDAAVQSKIEIEKKYEKIRQILSQQTNLDDNTASVLSSQDQKFIDSLYKLMEEELANSDLDVSSMTKRLGISRTKLYYKIKNLTGGTPSSFFRTYKLNRAAEMLRSGEHNVSEVSYLTGFNTISHFSRSFKQQFGISPSEYGR